MKINNLSNNDMILGFDKKFVNEVETQGDSFKTVLSNALGKVNDLQIESDNYNNLLVTNQITNIHDVSIAAEKANIAMQLTLTVRNKIVDAYKEVMRMQV